MVDFTALGQAAILDLLEREHAAVWHEIEAKYADKPSFAAPKGINPHRLSAARKQLVLASKIEHVTTATRGGGEITILAMADRRRRETAFEKAAARKRLLEATYLKWTRGARNSKRPNAIGDGGEIVAHASLAAAASSGVGYLLADRSKVGVSTLLGAPVPGGALDDGAYLTTLNTGRPVTITVPIEVKNIRQWIYPWHWELYQLLDKAARLQESNPDERIVPVLICRRAQWTTFGMAKDLGFMVLYTQYQPILEHSSVVVQEVEAINEELAYNLVRTAEPHEKVVDGFRSTLPRFGIDIAARWAQSAPIVGRFTPLLRQRDLHPIERVQTLHALRQAAADEIDGVHREWLGTRVRETLGLTDEEDVDFDPGW